MPSSSHAENSPPCGGGPQRATRHSEKPSARALFDARRGFARHRPGRDAPLVRDRVAVRREKPPAPWPAPLRPPRHGAAPDVSTRQMRARRVERPAPREQSTQGRARVRRLEQRAVAGCATPARRARPRSAVRNTTHAQRAQQRAVFRPRHDAAARGDDQPTAPAQASAAPRFPAGENPPRRAVAKISGMGIPARSGRRDDPCPPSAAVRAGQVHARRSFSPHPSDR